MKINIVSDLHIEFGIDHDFDLPGGDVLFLAGDIVCVNALKKPKVEGDWNWFIKTQMSKYERVVMLMGNHEHYNGNIANTGTILRAITKDIKNFVLLDNDCVEIKPDWFLYGSTFWTDYNRRDSVAMFTAQRGMNDHYLIRSGDGFFTPEHAFDLHKASNLHLRKMMYNVGPNKNWIVMTHHTPSIRSSHPKWGTTNPLNYAFHCTDMDAYIERNPTIKYWIHGHTHDCMDYTLGTTRVLCNPKGYPRENPSFNPNLEIEI